jgi:hypothetical protein
MLDMSESYDPAQAPVDFDGALTLELPVVEVARFCIDTALDLGLRLSSKSDSSLIFREPLRWGWRSVEMSIQFTERNRQTHVWVYGWAGGRRTVELEATSYVTALVSAFLAGVTSKSVAHGSSPESVSSGANSRRRRLRVLTLAQQASLPLFIVAVVVALTVGSVPGAFVGVTGFVVAVTLLTVCEFFRRRVLGFGTRGVVPLLILGLRIDFGFFVLIITAVAIGLAR